MGILSLLPIALGKRTIFWDRLQLGTSLGHFRGTGVVGYLPTLGSIFLANNCFCAFSTSLSVTDFCGPRPRSGWLYLHLLPYVHFLPYGQVSPPLRRAGILRKFSNVGPDLPSGSSGGMNLRTNKFRHYRHDHIFWANRVTYVHGLEKVATLPIVNE